MRAKECKGCRQTSSHFHKNKNNSDGLSSVCKACVSDYSRRRWANNKESESFRARQWRKANAEYLKIYEKGRNSKKRYWPHLTNEQALSVFLEMRKNQKECCAICNRHESNFKKGLVIDHCHATKKVRQLLCQNCNAMIGMAKENEEVLKAAIKYIQIHKMTEGDSCANF